MTRSLGALFLLLAACRPEVGPPPERARWESNHRRVEVIADLDSSARPRATPHCGASARLTAALPDPAKVDDRRGEWVEVVHDETWTLSLEGWQLRTDRRSKPLGTVLLAPGERLRMGGRGEELWPLRLRNRGGTLTLIDPCGLQVSTLSWGDPFELQPGPGEVVVKHPPWASKQETPPERTRTGFTVVAADGFEPST